MLFHPLLEKYIHDHLPPTALRDESLQNFLQAIQTCLTIKQEEAEVLRTQITERKGIEKELNRTVNLLVTLLTNLQSGILAEDENRMVLFANDLFCTTFGITDNPESLKGKDCARLLEEGKAVFQHAQTFTERVEEIIRDKKIVLGEELQLVNGEFIERDFIPLYIHNHYKGHLWHYKNITRRKKDEQQLRESNEKLQLLYHLINNTSDAIQVAQENGKLFYVNKEASSNIGIAQDDVSQYTVSDVEALFKEPGMWQKHVEEVRNLGNLTIEGEQFNQSTGQKFPVEVTVRYVTISGTGYMVANTRDITGRKKSEKLLKSQEEKYRNIIANMHLGLVEVDTEERIQYTNHGFQEICGYSSEELLGKKASDLFGTDEVAREIDAMKQKRANGISDMYELMVRNKNGEKKWWMISGAPNYNDDGELIGSIGIHLDITDQKRLGLDLELAKTRAEQASKAKEAFLANMSHEIRTPLNAINGMLRELHRDELSPKQSTYVNNSLSASKHLLAIINTILDISKIEAGELELEQDHFILQESVDRTTAMLKGRADEKDIYLKSWVSPKISEVVVGDAVRIEQILLNLIGNAIKFTDKGGVQVTVALAEDRTDSQTLELVISDTGIGMEPSYLKTIFSKFSQEDRSTSRKYGGTGLGMAITYELIQLMQGSIEIQSEKGVGTSYTIHLNLQKGHRDSIIKAPEAISEKQLLDTKILLVEDNDMNRLVVQNTLRFYGCDATEAVDGTEAIALLKQRSFDIILMDIQMPGMDGIEATQIIRNELKITTPIIALTANAFKTEIEKCKSIGMNDYVTKPFEESALLNTIFKLLKRPELTVQTDLEASKPPKNEVLYDLSNLEKVSRGDTAFVSKMIKLFIEQTQLHLTGFKQLLLESNYKEIARIAHKIKPGVESMGIVSLSESLRELEAISIDSANAERVQVLVQEISEVLEQVVAKLISAYQAPS
ncbi:hypothetical protein CNR22_17850 [Sphingobacteriaceae bacterium]|nr:hypothetical protein CNR22_17850 [Sphingobacteriaceae bacterium]